MNVDTVTISINCELCLHKTLSLQCHVPRNLRGSQINTFFFLSQGSKGKVTKREKIRTIRHISSTFLKKIPRFSSYVSDRFYYQKCF